MIISTTRSHDGFCRDCATPTAPTPARRKPRAKPTPGGLDPSQLDGELDHDHVRLYTGCPHCRVARGEPCISNTGRARPNDRLHQARWAKAGRAKRNRPTPAKCPPAT